MIKKIVLGTACLALICLIVNFSQQIVKLWGLTGVLKNKNNQVLLLEKENQVLESRLKKVADSSYVEEVAREKLGMAKTGEVVVVIPESDLLPPAVEESLPPLVWQQWWKRFAD